MEQMAAWDRLEAHGVSHKRRLSADLEGAAERVKLFVDRRIGLLK
jgi:hypothetical protein